MSYPRKSRNMHILQTSITVSQPADMSSPVAEGQVDLAVLLSQKYGRNVAQGRMYKVRGVGIEIVPRGVVDNVEGLGLNAQFAYCPCTVHSVKAWRIARSRWMAQKKLDGLAGKSVRYDDFEVAFNSSWTTSRTSTIKAQGIGDATEEKFVIFGGSQDGTAYALEDQYTSAYPIAPASEDPFTNSITKPPKYSQYFPSFETMNATGYFSATLSDSAGGTDTLSNGVVNTPITMLPDMSTAKVLAGVMKYTVWGVPESQGLPDNTTVRLSVYVEGWSTLAERKKKRKSNKPVRKYRTNTRKRR